MELHLTFYIDQPVPCEDLDDLSDLVREAVNKAIGETDYMVQEVSNYDVGFEILD